MKSSTDAAAPTMPLWMVGVLFAQCTVFCFIIWRYDTGDMMGVWGRVLVTLGQGTVTRLPMSFLKMAIMLWGLGFKWSEVVLYLGRKPIPVQQLCSHYGERYIMVMDGWARKLPKIVVGVLSIVAWDALAKMPIAHSGKRAAAWSGEHAGDIAYNSGVQFDAFMGLVSMAIEVGAAVFCDNILFNVYLCAIVRVRDGKLRRLNVATAVLTGLFAKTIAHIAVVEFLLVGSHAMPGDLKSLCLMLQFFPYEIGDAFAEVIGVLGTRRFEVRGIGEINNKSLEGCFGFVVTTLISCFLACYKQDASFPWYLLSVVLALVGMLVETWTPRGFDDFTILSSSFVVVFAFVKLGFGMEHQPYSIQQ